ncbi:hypothetical protein [Pedobacter sp.]|uniref:hypothetical protein n=1 Tax=Pedobacter sp. TaxID=1411316 RepID=UPI003C781E25
MKKLLILLLLAQVTFGQTVNVPTKEYVDAQVRTINARIDSAVKAIKPGIPPIVRPPFIKDCPRGPYIQKISDVTSTSAEVLFDGDGVFSIEYEVIRDGGSRVVLDSVRPQSSRVIINYPAQSDGTFNLIFRGKSCKSSDDKSQFKIKSNSGGVVLPPVVNPPVIDPPQTGSYQLKTLAQGMDEHMNLVVRDSGDIRVFTDIAPDQISPNHNYRYLINGEILTQKGRLTNYKIAGNNPIRIVKFRLRKDLSSINQWGTQESDYIGSSYYHRDAGELFSYNTSFAFHTYVPVGPQSKDGFLNPILWNYKPENQMISWPEIAPDMKLPAGQFWIGDWTGYTPDLVYSKGVTHLLHHWLPWNEADGNKVANALKYAGKTYNNVPRNEVIFNLRKLPPIVKPDGTVITDDYTGDGGTNKFWWPNGGFDAETAIRKANETGVTDAIWIGETMENESWTPDNWEMHRHFYKRLRERYEDHFGKRGIPYEIVFNYYYLWPEPISLSRNRNADYFRKLLVTKPEDLPKTPYSPGGVLTSTTMITEGIYLGAPDIQIGVIYETIYRFHINKILGYRSGVFLAGQHEYRPNNKYMFSYPEGKFYTDKKVPLDPNVHIAAGFIAQVYGNLFIEWGAAGKKDHKNQSYEWSKGLWFPNGSTFPQNGFPYYSYTNDYYGGFDGGADLSYFSQRLFNETFGQTHGGERAYLKHRIDGREWITPDQSFGQEIVNAYEQKRGFVLSQKKNGKTAWFYLNSYADNNWHTLEVQLPDGQIKIFKVSGNAVHARLEQPNN